MRVEFTTAKELKSYLTKPLRLPALARTAFRVERDDATGGSGANFLVEWIAEKEVTEAIFEAVIIDTKGQQETIVVSELTLVVQRST